jgi:hypothetical protein
VWQEFEELFEHEAAQLASYVAQKIRMKPKYHIGAAAIADKCNPGFPLSPYDNKTDWYAASVSVVEKRTLITAADQLKMYMKLGCSSVMSLEMLAS